MRAFNKGKEVFEVILSLLTCGIFMFRLIITQGILHIFFKSEKDQVHLLNLDLDQGIVRVLLLLLMQKGSKVSNLETLFQTHKLSLMIMCASFFCLFEIVHQSSHKCLPKPKVIM